MNLRLLNIIASQPFEECEAEWKEVLGGLRLGMIYVPAIQRVLAEGRWKDAPDPVAYVRKAARRLAVRLGIVERRRRGNREVPACDLHYEDEQGRALGHDDRLGTALYRHKEKFGWVYPGNRNWAEGRVKASLYNEEPEIDWERAGDLAGLDSAENLVVQLQLIGFTRRTAVRACLTELDRRYMEAAWKRFERSRKRLGQALETGETAEGRPREAEWPELELQLVETDEGMKISFSTSVPKEGV